MNSETDEAQKIELTQSQIDALIAINDALVKVFEAFNDILVIIKQAVKEFLEAVKKYFYIPLGRMLFKHQLIELKFPYWIANYISENLYWYWACGFGFSWFEKRFVAVTN